MKKFIKRVLLRIFLATLVVATAFSADNANAAQQLNSSSRFYTKVARCSVTDYDSLMGCWYDWLGGALDDSEIVSGSTSTKVSSGETLIVMVYLHPDTSIDIAGGQVLVTWESDDFDLVSDNAGPLTFFDKEQLPKDSRRKYNWVNSMDLQADGESFMIQFSDGFTGGSGNSATPMEDDTAVGVFALTAKTLPGGGASQVRLSETIGEGTDISDYSSQNYTSTSEQFTINYTGTSTSSDATLSALAVTNGNGSVTYPLDPAFSQSAAAQSVFSTKVPSDTSQIKIIATANDNKAQKIRLFDNNVIDTATGGTIISDSSTVPIVGVGSKSVGYGDNYFTIAVTAQNGDVRNEVVRVYRLSSDATLNNLAVDGYSFTTSFTPNGTPNYTISDTLPYSIKSINIVGATNESHATVTNLGNWTFSPDTTAAQAYTREIIVTPEECSYTSGANAVQGASCNPKTYTITVNREAASNDASLKSLSATYIHTTGSPATTGELITSFDSNYIVDLGNVPYSANSISYTAQANQNKAKKISFQQNTSAATDLTVSGTPITGNATCNLTVIGDNTCKFTVTAEDGQTTRTYTVKAHRLSNDASLKTLKVTVATNPNGNTLQPAFPNSPNDEYTYLYNEDVTSYAVEATVNDTDKTAQIVMTGPGKQKTETGNSITETFTASGDKDAPDAVTIAVTSENGDVRTYKINLKREVSSDASLSSIVVTTSNGTTTQDHTIPLTTNTYNYTLNVGADTDTITNVVATAKSKYASVQNNDISFLPDLQFGTGTDATHNKISIQGTPEQGNKSQYNITVNRAKYDIAGATAICVRYGSETNCTNVDGVSASQDGDFVLSTKTSNPLSFDTKTMNISVTPANRFATITGEGEKSLVANKTNDFTITVASQDGSVSRTYTLHVYRNGDPDNSFTSLTVKGVAPQPQSDTLYTMTVPYNVTEITENDVVVIKKSNDANVAKSGTLYLNVGIAADYNFTITSQSGDAKTYTVRITRLKNTESDASRITLQLSDESNGTRFCYPTSSDPTCSFSIPYNKSQYYLQAAIPYGAHLDDSGSYVDSDDLLTIDDSGTSTHQIKVVSQDGSTNRIYTITVTREKSTDTSLDDLNLSYTLSDGTSVTKQTVPNFSTSKDSYNVTVPGDVQSIRIGAVLHDKRGYFVETNSSDDYDHSFDLSYGLNELTFDVKSESDSPKTYTVNVMRTPKSNPYIQSITINGTPLNDLLVDGTTYAGDQADDPNEYTYTLKPFANDVSSILIGVTMVDAPTATEPGASARIESGNATGNINPTINYPLKTIYYGNATNVVNKIDIYGVAHNGTTKKKYTLYVTRNASDEATRNKDADAVRVRWDGAWHNATWNDSENHYEIIVPNSLKVVNSENVMVKAKPASDDYSNPSTVAVDPQMNLVTNDPTNGNKNYYGYTVTSESGNNSRHYDIVITRTLADDATLKSLAVNNADNTKSIGSFLPSFDPGIYDYTVSVNKDVDEIYIAAELNEDHASVTGTGYKQINSESSVFDVVVTPENGDTAKIKTYKLTVVRAKSDDATLSTFKVLNLDDIEYEMTPVFNPNDSTTLYEVIIPGDQDKVKLTYAGSTNLANGVTQQIVYTVAPDENTNNTFSIPTGSSKTLGVEVTAENGTAKRTYQVKVTRTKRADAALSSLTYTFSDTGEAKSLLDVCVFADEEFRCTVPTQQSGGPTGITFGATATDNEASITGDVSEEKIIKTGYNNYQITVTAEDTTTQQVYKISLLKLPSTNALLRSLTVKDYNLTSGGDGFKPEVTNYDVTVGELMETFSISNFTYQQDSNKSTVDYLDQITLTAGQDNFFHIIVYSESCANDYAGLRNDHLTTCNMTDYSINVDRPLSTNNRLLSVAVDSVTRLSPTFTNNQYKDYTITIPYGGTDFDITATPEKDVSTVTDSLGCIFSTDNNKTCRVAFNNLPVDPNNSEQRLYSITVTPQAGTNPRTYEFVVKSARSDDKNLSSLKVRDKAGNLITMTPGFEMDEKTYRIPDITNDVTEFTVYAEANNSDATIRYIYQSTQVCGNVASCKINVNTANSEQTVQVEVTPADSSAPKVYTINYNIVADNDATLASITVDSPFALNQSFDPEKDTYSIDGLTYDDTPETVNLKFKTSDPDAKININNQGDFTGGTVEWIVGLNFDHNDKKAQTITTVVKVTAEDGSNKTYTVTATRAAALASTDASLTDIKVDGTTITDFGPGEFDYNLGAIDFQKTSLLLDVYPNNEEARVFIDGAEETVTGGKASKSIYAPLENDEHTITIRVVAGDNIHEQVYTVKYHKVGNNDPTLASLTFSKGSLDRDFDPAVETYTLSLPEGLTTEVTAVPNDPNATMVFGTTTNSKQLKSGEPMGVTGLTETTNERKLWVNSEDGSPKVYTITIIRTTGDDKITSYEYGHEINDNYIMSVADYSTDQTRTGTMTLGTLKDQLDNNNDNLHGYKTEPDGTVVELSEDDIIGTGVIIRLISDENVLKDTKIVIIRGDIDGDGKVNMIDYGFIRNHYTRTSIMTDEIKLLAGDVNSSATSADNLSSQVNMIDYGFVRNHYTRSAFIDYQAMLNPSGGGSSGG